MREAGEVVEVGVEEKKSSEREKGLQEQQGGKRET